MTTLTLHVYESGNSFLVNYANVTDIHSRGDCGSEVFFSFAIDDKQSSILVSESLIEICDMLERNKESTQCS